ncbi:MAG: VCBS repeat-containing protein [Deltaproteobacteria bacterium]|nr:VCBS repeat-containing protein [Deltaproteobacteria bacterium]
MQLRLSLVPVAAAFALAACGGDDAAPADASGAAESAASAAPAAAPATPADLPRGLLLALSTFRNGDDGKPIPQSELVVVTRSGGAWNAASVSDPDSNVFHKAMVVDLPGHGPSLVTLGAMKAAVKRWQKGDAGLAPAETLWEAKFGGTFDRMRDGEAADLFGDGKQALAIATHDQGVVAVLRAQEGGGWAATELDRKPDTFVHEIELGDLDGDGVREIYATPSAPNKLDGSPQPGEVVRFVPGKGEGRAVVADLGMRHAKEILVADVDGDGRDELYVSVEAAEGGNLEVKRYDAGTDPTAGAVVVTLADPMCRFLTAGDLDGDGKQEMVVAAKDTGLWLARPGADAKAPWTTEHIDADSKGFEHAALLTDLDGDGVDELYVANDKAKQLNRYVWANGKAQRETIYTSASPNAVLTWNLMPAPVELVK